MKARYDDIASSGGNFNRAVKSDRKEAEEIVSKGEEIASVSSSILSAYYGVI
jgi:hypothetical protein